MCFLQLELPIKRISFVNSSLLWLNSVTTLELIEIMETIKTKLLVHMQVKG